MNDPQDMNDPPDLHKMRQSKINPETGRPERNGEIEEIADIDRLHLRFYTNVSQRSAR